MKENWTYKKLGEVCEIICGQDYKSIQDDNGMFPIYGTGGVMGRASQYRCPAYSIIIGRKGNINNPLFVEEPFWNVDTAFGVVPNASVLFPKFFYFFCKNYDFTKHDVSVTIPSLRRADIINIAVPIPPLSEQSRIVSEHDLLQSIIDKQKAQLKELDNLAQAVFYDMFGDPVENEKGWEVKKLGEICLLKAGKAIKASELSYNDAPSLFPCYGGNGVRGYINKYSHTESYPIVGRQGALCGNVNYAEAPFYATEHAVVVKPIKAIDTKWLFFQLKFMRLNQYAHGVAQPGLAVQDLEPLDCALPPLALQQSFAAKIESIEKQKAAITQSIAETQRLFDYTMDKYFG